MNSGAGDTTQLVPGFPIRTPWDHSSVDSSPRPIAASHVLHRLLVPRHPPCALSNLTTKMLASTVQFSTNTTTNPHTTTTNPETLFWPFRSQGSGHRPKEQQVVLSGPNRVFGTVTVQRHHRPHRTRPVPHPPTSRKGCTRRVGRCR